MPAGACVDSLWRCEERHVTIIAFKDFSVLWCGGMPLSSLARNSVSPARALVAGRSSPLSLSLLFSVSRSTRRARTGTRLQKQSQSPVYNNLNAELDRTEDFVGLPLFISRPPPALFSPPCRTLLSTLITLSKSSVPALPALRSCPPSPSPSFHSSSVALSHPRKQPRRAASSAKPRPPARHA